MRKGHSRNIAEEAKKPYTLYMHVVPKELSGHENDKYYIGITCQDLDKRFKKGFGYDKCPLIHKAIKKYGWDNIQHLALMENLTQHDASVMEKLMIAHFKSNDPKYGYNLNEGGYIGNVGYHHSEEMKLWYSMIQRGKPPHNKGYKASEETRAKQREAWKKRKERGGELGTKKPVIVFPINKRYDSLIDACRDLGLNYGSAEQVAQGRRTSLYGYTFKYVGGYINHTKEVI